MNVLPTIQFGKFAQEQPANKRSLTPNVVSVDTDRLISSRLLIQANSGGGKSRALRSLLEQTNGTVQQIVLDPEGEFASLRERYPYVLAGKEGGEVPITPLTARLLCRRLMEIGVSAVLDLYDLSLPERRRFVRLFLEELMHLPRDLWRPLLVVIDEAHIFCPERGAGESESTEAVITLCTQGRKRGYCAVLATQRIAKLHKDAAAELLNKMIGRTGLDVDIRRASDELGLDREQKSQLRLLRPGSFYAFGPAIKDGQGITLVQTAPVNTTHPEPGKIAPPPPPAPDAIKSLAIQFADLPKEAQQEVTDLHTAKQRIEELESIVHSKSVPTDTSTIQRIEIPVEVPVFVPALNKADLEYIEHISEKLTNIAQGIVSISQDMLRLLARDTVSLCDAHDADSACTSVNISSVIDNLDVLTVNLSMPQQRIILSLAANIANTETTIACEELGKRVGQPVPKSGFWSNVNDLKNKGLINITSNKAVGLTPEGCLRAAVLMRQQERTNH